MRKTIKILSISMLTLTGALVLAGNYFYTLAIKVGPKDFIEEEIKEIWKPAENWLHNVSKETLQIKSDDGFDLEAWFIPAAQPASKTIVVAHGYGNDKSRMGQYIKLFHDAGYHVLAPDARGHGKSSGDYIGFGWPERRDMIQWLQTLADRFGPNHAIGMYGLSMGASTVMMTSGEADLPQNVKAFIADCGYTSAAEELSFKLKQRYNLPAFPMIPITSFVTQVRVGYNFYEASAVEQIKKNSRPLLLIHGDADDFVPTDMVYTLYEAQRGPKELWIVSDAGHADAYEVAGEVYRTRLLTFMADQLQN